MTTPSNNPAPSNQRQTPRVMAIATRIPAHAKTSFAVDGTGSQRAVSDGSLKIVQGINDHLEKKVQQNTCSVFRCGDQDFNEPIVPLLQDGTPDEAEEAVRKIDFAGGEDEAETHLQNFADILEMLPTAGPTERVAFIALTTGPSKPLRSGQTPRELGEAFKQHNIVVCVAGEECPLIREFVDAVGADGFFFQISNDPDDNELKRVADRIGASIVASMSTARRTVSAVAAA
jgi:hypothetical protein